MKKTLQKSVLSVLLILLTLCSVMIPSASAEGEKKITYVECYIDAPVYFEKPSSRIQLDNELQYTPVSYTWTDDESGEVLSPDDKFVYGKSYTAEIVFEALEGYVFDTEKIKKVLMYDIAVPCAELTPTRCVVRRSYECAPVTLRYVSFFVQEPHEGWRITTQLTKFPTDIVTCTGFRWIDDATGETMQPGSYFGDRGKTYTIELEFDVNKEGYVFADKHWLSVFENHTRYETDPAELTPSHIVARHSYRCTYYIDTASAEISPPVPGETPSYDVTFPEGAHYISVPTMKDNDTMKNAVCWREMDGSSDGRLMSTDEKFEAGKDYRVTIWIGPENEDYYVWLSDTFVNGEKGGWIRANEVAGALLYTFTCGEPAPKYPLTVKVRSFLSEKNPTTVQLIKNGYIAYAALGTGARAECKFENVQAGDYTMRVYKKNHATRELSVTVSDEATISTKLHPLGDINGDGEITTRDYSKAFSHVTGTNELKGYELACADVVGSTPGDVTSRDLSAIFSHLTDTKHLW